MNAKQPKQPRCSNCKKFIKEKESFRDFLQMKNGETRMIQVCESCKDAMEMAIRELLREGEATITHCVNEKADENRVYDAANWKDYDLPRLGKSRFFGRNWYAQKEAAYRQEQEKKMFAILNKAPRAGALNFEDTIASAISGANLSANEMTKVRMADGCDKIVATTFAQDVIVMDGGNKVVKVLVCHYSERKELTELIKAGLAKGIIRITNYTKDRNTGNIGVEHYDARNSADYRFIPTAKKALMMRFWDDELERDKEVQSCRAAIIGKGKKGELKNLRPPAIPDADVHTNLGKLLGSTKSA